MFVKLKAHSLRRALGKIDTKRDEGLIFPEDVRLVEGIAYGGHKMHTLEVNLPAGAENPPLIINVHGGGYVYGSTLPYRHYCASLARRGFAVVSFNYRLAPEFKFPTPLEDLNAVVGWCLEHSGEYGFSTENVFMVGDSAGAQLVSHYAAMVSNREFADIMEIIPPAELKLRAVGLNCGMYDLREVLTHIGSPKDVMECYFTKKHARFGRKLDVLDFITENYPPTQLISAPGDFLYHCCEPMWQHLVSRGVEAECKIYGTEKTHHVFHVNMKNPLSTVANDCQTEFFRRHMK